ncbi:hypothetical protein ABZ297_01940 [Nonomuraea sp. NPDC005983]
MTRVPRLDARQALRELPVPLAYDGHFTAADVTTWLDISERLSR